MLLLYYRLAYVMTCRHCDASSSSAWELTVTVTVTTGDSPLCFSQHTRCSGPCFSPPPTSTLSFLSMEHGECCICYEVSSNCISCDSEHHLCSGCLDLFAQTEAVYNKHHINANKGSLRCPGTGCSHAFKQSFLAQHLPEETLELFLTAWELCLEQKAAQAEAIEAMQALSHQGAATDADAARTYIVNSILTLQCPSCTKAFDNFDGCFALMCQDEGGHGCRAGFCAYCLELCGTNAHAHVGACTFNASRSVHGSIDRFHAVQRVRRRRIVLEYLETLAEPLREQVQLAIAADLHDLGISLDHTNDDDEELLAKTTVEYGDRDMFFHHFEDGNADRGLFRLLDLRLMFDVGIVNIAPRREPYFQIFEQFIRPIDIHAERNRMQAMIAAGQRERAQKMIQAQAAKIAVKHEKAHVQQAAKVIAKQQKQQQRMHSKQRNAGGNRRQTSRR
jgi:hypothetical protein